MPRLTFNEAHERVTSMQHLLYATKDINYWEFTEEPVPSGSPPTMVVLYKARDTKTGIVQPFPIDQVDIQHHGTLENVYKHIHRSFATSLTVLGQAIDQAKLAKSNLLLPKYLRHQGTRMSAFKRLQKGDHDH
jgi:hypothetical protein